MLKNFGSIYDGFSMKIDKSQLSEEQLKDLEIYHHNRKQLKTLEEIASMAQEVITLAEKDKYGKSIGDLGVLLTDIRESLAELKKKEVNIPDYAKPIVAELKKLKLNPQIKVNTPDVNVPEITIPQINVPEIDVKGLKKAFAEAIKQIPETKIPESDYSPVLQVLEGISEQLASIDVGTRLNPTGNVKVINASEIGGGGGLTDAELRATPVKVDDDETQTKLDTIAGNQLPDNHQVTVSNPTADPETGLAKDATLTNNTQTTQLVDAGGEAATVTGGKLDVNASVDTTGLALDTSLNSIALSAATGVASGAGDTTILSVAGGTQVRIYHWSAVPTTSSTTDVNIVFKIGSNSIQGWRTNTNGGGWAHSPKNGLSYFEGADGEDVVINLSGADSIRWNLSYEIV